MYFGTPSGTVDVAAGFPFAGQVTAPPETSIVEIPGGDAVESIHVGPYEDLATTYAAIAEYLNTLGQDLLEKIRADIESRRPWAQRFKRSWRSAGTMSERRRGLVGVGMRKVYQSVQEYARHFLKIVLGLQMRRLAGAPGPGPSQTIRRGNVPGLCVHM